MNAPGLIRPSSRSPVLLALALAGLVLSHRALGADVVTNALLRFGRGDNLAVTQLDFSPDGQRVLTGARDDPINVWYGEWDSSEWHAETGELIRKVESSGVLLASRFAAGRPLVLVPITADGRLRVLDVATDQVVGQFPNTGYLPGLAYKGVISPDGNLVLSTHGLSAPARLWDVQSGNFLRSIQAGTGVVAVAFSVDGQRILTGDADNAVRVWDLQTTNLLRTCQGSGDQIRVVADSANGQLVVSGSRAGTAMLWDVATANLLHTLQGHRSEIWGAAFSPNSELVLTGSLDGPANVWATATGQLLRTFDPGSTPTCSVAWSPDGRYVLTGHADATARLWSVVGLGERLEIAPSGPGAELRWNLGVLQEAGSLAGPWHDVPGATSPFEVELSGVQRFYRLKIEE